MGEKQSKGRQLSLTVRSNVAINLVRTLAMTLLSFITFPFITRALGDEAFGLYSWANSFVYYFLILAKISIPNLAIRECVKAKGDREQLSATVQKFFLLQSFTTLASFALLCIFVFSVPSLYSEAEIIFLLSINFLVGVFSFEWVYIALEKHFYITVRSVFLIAFSSCCTFLFIKPTAYPEQYLYLYSAIAILPTIGTSIFNCIFLHRYVSLRKTTRFSFRPLIKPLSTMALLSFALTVYNQTDEFILGFVDPSKAAVGAYAVGVKGVDIIITLTTSLYAVFLPRASYYHELEDKAPYKRLLDYSFNITFFIAVPAIATMTSLSLPITALISGGDMSSSYQDANWILFALCFMMLTYSLSDNIYNEILIPERKEKYYLYAMAMGVALNIGLSLLFALVVMKDRAGLGVAIATMIADVCVLVLLYFLSRKYAKGAIFNLNNLKITAFGIAIFLLNFFVLPLLLKMDWGDSTQAGIYLGSGLILLAADAAIYLVGLRLTKEKLVCSLFRRKDMHGESKSEGE